MTYPRSDSAIFRVLLEHDGPMTIDCLTHEIGVCRSSIERTLKKLIAEQVVEVCGQYINPGTKKACRLIGPGPLVRLWAMRHVSERGKIE